MTCTTQLLIEGFSGKAKGAGLGDKISRSGLHEKKDLS
eukprot:CAMPEP_0171578132 /NCGR_PEP_ID=MMETSP0961-20121227/7662_1 /TAXON_ID=87120 /ORGANISM="Aurantiochytrium limacinum, Strain ATCCMYA-1381" /LENGTH=37 /DNA_ID= /DNA_START= /DNA_END= /DNA_ORIENTATION=